jgi:hypothetical protein
MKNKLLFLIFLAFNTLSCSYQSEVDMSSLTPTVSEKEEIVDQLQGNYSSCRASPSYPGSYELNAVSVSGTTYTYISSLSASGTCSTTYYTSTNIYEINNASYVNASLNKEDIQLEFKVQSTSYSFNDNWYLSQNYCGFNDWALNVAKDVTGVPCNNLLSTYDSFHTSFKALNDLDYVQIKRTSTSIAHPAGFSESGDTPADARKSMLFEMSSI